MKLFLKVLFKDLYHNISSKEAREFLRLLNRYGDKKRFTGLNLKAGKYQLYIPDSLSFLWQYKEIFVDEIYKFTSNSKTPVIYDCGANIGLSGLYFKKIYPNAKIKAFEADQNIARILSNNLRNNNAADIEVINKAVWINDSGIEMVFTGADSASIYSEGVKEKVETLRLKDLLEKEERIDFLKIDIEGAEIEVLKDCRNSLNNIDNLFIEYHSFTSSKQDLAILFEILEENNFRYFIKQPMDRTKPFINRISKDYPEMDLQLNIFAYKK